MGVPNRVLRKPGSLTPEEFEVIKQHVVPSKLIIEATVELRRVAGRQLDPELMPLFGEAVEEKRARLATVNMTLE